MTITEVYQECAKALEKSVDQLTDDQKRQALLNAVLEQGGLEGFEFIAGQIERTRRIDRAVRAFHAAMTATWPNGEIVE